MATVRINTEQYFSFSSWTDLGNTKTDGTGSYGYSKNLSYGSTAYVGFRFSDSYIASKIPSGATINSIKLYITSRFSDEGTYRFSANSEQGYNYSSATTINTTADMDNTLGGKEYKNNSTDWHTAEWTLSNPSNIRSGLIVKLNAYSGRVGIRQIHIAEAYIVVTYTVPSTETINNIYVGDTKVKDIYVGSQKVKSVYVGDKKIYG